MQSDRTVPNNKPDIIIRHNEKGAGLLIDIAISGNGLMIKKLSGEDSTIIRPHNRNSEHVERNSKHDNCNIGNRLKITQTIPEQQTGKTRN